MPKKIKKINNIDFSEAPADPHIRKVQRSFTFKPDHETELGDGTMFEDDPRALKDKDDRVYIKR